MDAKAIHDLYAPLWERVPETRPVYSGGWLMLKPDAGPLHCAKWGSVFTHDYALDEGSALALCRMAVIEWLMVHGRGDFVKVEKTRSGFYVAITTAVHEENSTPYMDHPAGEGPTLDHALVSAAMAVAGEKK